MFQKRIKSFVYYDPHTLSHMYPTGIYVYIYSLFILYWIIFIHSNLVTPPGTTIHSLSLALLLAKLKKYSNPGNAI